MKRFGQIETALSKHDTWKSGFMRSQLTNLVLAITTLIALLVMLIAINTEPEIKYFAAREDGGILPIVAVDQPFLTDSQINNFAVEAVTRSFTMSFQNYRIDLDEASKYFLKPDGWAIFRTSLEQSGTITDIVNNKLTSSAVAHGSVVMDQGISPRGNYGWLVQVPLTITYLSTSETKRDEWIADIEILRVPNQEMSRGVGISKISMRRGSVR